MNPENAGKFVISMRAFISERSVYYDELIVFWEVLNSHTTREYKNLGLKIDHGMSTQDSVLFFDIYYDDCNRFYNVLRRQVTIPKKVMIKKWYVKKNNYIHSIFKR